MKPRSLVTLILVLLASTLAPQASDAATPSKIVFTKSGAQITRVDVIQGQRVQLGIAGISGKAVTRISPKKAVWQSSNASILKVTAGLVKTYRKGRAKVTATYKRKRATIWVTVLKKGSPTPTPVPGQTPISNPSPTPTAASAHVISVKANSSHGALLSSGGGVWSAGLKASPYGSTPVVRKIPGLENIVAIDCSPEGGAAVDKDGKLYLWTIDYSSMEPNAATLSDKIGGLKSVATGGNGYSASDVFTLALGNNGELYAWGDNRYYQMGVGTTDAIINPVMVMRDVKAVSAGDKFTVAVNTNGEVWYWGRFSFGGTAFTTPTQLTGVGPVSAVDAGGSYALAAEEATGRVYAFGHLAAGYVPDILSPIQMSAGFETIYAPTFIKSDGSTWDVSISMADGSMTTERVNGMDDIRLFDASDDAFYIRNDGSLLIQSNPDTVGYVVTDPLG